MLVQHSVVLNLLLLGDEVRDLIAGLRRELPLERCPFLGGSKEWNRQLLFLQYKEHNQNLNCYFIQSSYFSTLSQAHFHFMNTFVLSIKDDANIKNCT